jgi:DNA-binding transcriptional ArsR family regulator
MAFAKFHLYPTHLQQEAVHMKLMCHPERLSILDFLYQNGPQSVKDIVRHSPLHHKVVSQHLSILRKSDLISYTEKFPTIIYAVNEEVLEKVTESFSSFCHRFAVPPDTIKNPLPDFQKNHIPHAELD